MQKFLNLVISGTVTGAIYSMMAAGLVLTFQTSGIFNFAHGAIAFTTAYFYYQLNTGQGMPIVPAAVLSVLVFAPLLGLLLDRLVLRRLATAPVYARIVGTIGLLVALPALAQWLVEAVGNDLLDLGLPAVANTQAAGGTAPGIGPTPPHVFHPLQRVVLDTDQLAVFAAAAFAAFALWFVIRKTRVGLEMRAVVDKHDLAQLRGVSPRRTSAVAWILTMVLAGLGGVLISPLFQLNETYFLLVVLGSLAAVALSGLRSIPIAFLGGLALGVVQNLVAGYGDTILPGFLNRLSGFRSAVPFILTLVLLFVVGRRRGREAGFVSDEQPPVDHRAGLPAWRRRLPWVLVTVALVVYVQGWIHWAALDASPYEAGLVATGLATAIVFLSFNVVTGLGGMVSLAQATFVTAGGFCAGWALNRDWGFDVPLVVHDGRLSFGAAALLGALLAAAIGAIVAIPVRHLGAVALAIGTFALAFVADLVPFHVESISKGSFGWVIPAPSLDLPLLGTFDFSQPDQQAMLLLVVFGVAALLFHGLQRSASGRSMLAVRSSEVAARTAGISPAKVKIALFALSAGIAGFGGAMLGMVNLAITQSTAPPLIGLVWVTVVVTWGVRRPGGALLAGLSFAALPALFTWLGRDVLPNSTETLVTSTYFTSILFGLGAINLAKQPDGLLALVGHQRLARRRERDRRERIEIAEAGAHGGAVPEHERVHAAGAAAGSPVAAPTPAAPTPAAPTPAAPTVTGPPAAGPASADAGAAPVPEAPPPALALDEIVAGYGEVEVLHGVSIVVASGTVTALLGANGAGKSTLCAVTSGLLPPTAGRVLVAGEDVTAGSAYRRARLGVILAPEARGVFPGLSVEENLQLLLRRPDDRERAYDRFPILGERRRQPAGLLSGGEQQMLSLAPALASPPPVFVADEPTLGLAPLAAEVVIEALRELRDRGSAILLVEEKAREAMRLADTVAFMELGRIVWTGPRDAADTERLTAAYLGGVAPAGP